MSFIKNMQARRQPDEELVSQYKATGNMELLSALYQPYMDLLYGVCLKYLQDAELAKDAVIDIFEELTVKLHRYEVLNFKAWVYQLAKNHCLMKLRAGKKFTKTQTDPELMQNSLATHLEDGPALEENLQWMEDCLQQLPAGQKQAVELFYLQQKCYNEIAETTGIEWNKVRSFIQNGRRNLKICMEKLAGEQ